MGSRHVDGIKVDQINNVVVEGVEIMEDIAVMMEECMHESSIFNEWDQGEEAKKSYKEGDGIHRRNSDYCLCVSLL